MQAILKVLEGGKLDAKEAYSFNLPPIRSEGDWDKLLQQTWNDAEKLASCIEMLPAHRFDKNFADEKYGSYYRNLQGLIEHSHYHLGQIVLIKKWLNRSTG